jgi:hypothetical protein
MSSTTFVSTSSSDFNAGEPQKMSTTHRYRDRAPDGKLLRKYRGTRGTSFPRGTPKWWRKIHMTRPRRRDNRALCHRITKGEDSERQAFPLGNRKPHVYYW